MSKSNSQNTETSTDSTTSTTSKLRSTRKTQALPLGLGALFNHAPLSSPHQNTGFLRDVEKGCIRYVTLREVERGEELCICYGRGSELGFDVVGREEGEREGGERQGSTVEVEGGEMDALGMVEGVAEVGEVFD